LSYVQTQWFTFIIILKVNKTGLENEFCFYLLWFCWIKYSCRSIHSVHIRVSVHILLAKLFSPRFAPERRVIRN
jgi:hypothetical protein